MFGIFHAPCLHNFLNFNPEKNPNKEIQKCNQSYNTTPSYNLTSTYKKINASALVHTKYL